MNVAETAPALARVEKKWVVWLGRALSALPAAMLTMSGVVKLSHLPDFVKRWTETMGFPEGALTGVGLIELACVAVYLVPRTATLGAILVAAYLGGAVATHVRLGDYGGVATPVLLGVLAWAGLWLRDRRLRELFPLRGRSA